MNTSARIIADSKNSFGTRLTTFVIVFPRIILAELNTHRCFSRNSASSRAIPITTMLKRVLDNPFIPLRFLKAHSSMVGTEYFEGEYDKLARERWLLARDRAVESATSFLKLDGSSDVTKQLVNRIIEPFGYHEVIISGTEWENFFALRCHPDAEIHMQHLAQLMLDAYNKSEPKELKEGEWHIAFGEQFDMEKVTQLAEKEKMTIDEVKRAICCARCARISYVLHSKEEKYNYEKDLELYRKLISEGHFSPLEHCAYAAGDNTFHGNFRGFIQLRKLLPDENRKDTRVIAK